MRISKDMDNLLRKSKEIRTILGGTQDKMRKEARDLVSITANTLKNVRNQYSRASGKRVPDLNFGVLHGIVKASDTNEKNNSKKARNRVGYGPSNIFGVCRDLIIPLPPVTLSFESERKCDIRLH